MTDQLHSRALALLQRLKAKKERIQAECKQRLEDIDRQIEAVSTTLQLLREEPEKLEVEVASAIQIRDSVSLASLTGKSARQALIEIAKKNQGIVKIVEARPLLLSAGILTGTKKENLWGAIYTELERSKHFEKHPTLSSFGFSESHC